MDGTADKSNVKSQAAHETAVSSDSSSSASSDSEPETVATKTTTHEKTEVQRQPPNTQLRNNDKNNEDDEMRTPAFEPATSPPPPKILSPEEAYDEFYLRQATKEFANDLDKLRSASDFRAGSVDVLVKALGQGRACFTADERRRVGAVALASTDGR